LLFCFNHTDIKIAISMQITEQFQCLVIHSYRACNKHVLGLIGELQELSVQILFSKGEVIY